MCDDSYDLALDKKLADETTTLVEQYEVCELSSFAESLECLLSFSLLL